jgi:hypothetical protein
MSAVETIAVRGDAIRYGDRIVNGGGRVEGVRKQGAILVLSLSYPMGVEGEASVVPTWDYEVERPVDTRAQERTRVVAEAKRKREAARLARLADKHGVIDG